MSILNLGTYPPKQCGIASFSKDLRDNLVEAGRKVHIAAISDREYSYAYPPEVMCEIHQDNVEDYLNAAHLVNSAGDIDVVVVQHEYGIFGGADGEYVLEFLSHLTKPYMVVAHTVLPHPSPGQKRVLREVTRKASAVICMTGRSARLMAKVYSVQPEKVYIIHHGVPVFQEKDRGALKRQYGFEGRQVITTFGLIGPGKGLENGIKALALIVDKHPDALYLIAGGTHPMLLKREGEKYREMLLELTARLGLENHVKFINRFLELDELGDFLYMTDVYLSPYPNRDQAVSGTLSYAIGCGRAIVSTPYEYALEMLKEGHRGLLAPNARPEAIAELLDRVLSNPILKMRLEKVAHRLGRTIKWPYVAKQYANLAERVAKTSLYGVKGQETAR